eukprot:6203685-Pleurochrysis_carterae.AAC.3
MKPLTLAKLLEPCIEEEESVYKFDADEVLTWLRHSVPCSLLNPFAARSSVLAMTLRRVCEIFSILLVCLCHCDCARARGRGERAAAAHIVDTCPYTLSQVPIDEPSLLCR